MSDVQIHPTAIVIPEQKSAMGTIVGPVLRHCGLDVVYLVQIAGCNITSRSADR